MGDFTIVDERLTTALDNLRYVNRFLGGYRAAMAVLGSVLRAQPPERPLRVLDLATGVADFPDSACFRRVPSVTRRSVSWIS